MALSPRSRGIIAADGHWPFGNGRDTDHKSLEPLIDEGARLAAIKAAHIIVAFDVYDKESLAHNRPPRASRHTVLTPQLGYEVEETWSVFYPPSVENALACLDGAAISVVNAS